MFHGEPLDAQRSAHMATIRGKNTKPELALRQALSAAGCRYRVHVKSLPGTPDVANQRAKVAIFVDGCFWHGCPAHGTMPITRREFWLQKIRRNQQRRIEVRASYAKGWRLFEVFECQLRGESRQVMAPIMRALKVKASERPLPFGRRNRPESTRREPPAHHKSTKGKLPATPADVGRRSPKERGQNQPQAP